MDFPRRGHQRLWSKILSDKPIAGFADCTVNNNYKPLDGSGVENTYKFLVAKISALQRDQQMLRLLWFNRSFDR